MLETLLTVLTATLMAGILFVYWITKTKQFKAFYDLAVRLDIPGATKYSREFFADILARCWSESPNMELPHLIKTIPECLARKIPGSLVKGMMSVV